VTDFISQNLQTNLLWLTEHALMFTISVNDHRGSYATVAEELERFPRRKADFESEADMLAAVLANVEFDLVVYPRTPVGYYNLSGSTLERLVERACEITAHAKGYRPTP
jgi:hypothetical protein